jgi:hypothetical protein
MNEENLQGVALAERILDAFPSGSYAMAGLLRLLDIVETEEVPTAAVECKVQPRMLINPRFVEQYAATPEKLLMLVMHELHHVLLGHTTLFPRLTPVQNFVFDAVINGVVCRMFPAAEYTTFFTDFYRDDRFPECLLRPAQGWPGRYAQAPPGFAQLPEALRQRAAEVHAALYSETGASYDEVYSLLPKLIGDLGEMGDLGVPLLGGHAQGSEAHDGLDQDSPLLFEIVRELVEQWPQPPNPIKGRSLADVLNKSSVSPAKTRSNRSILRGLIQKVAGQRGHGRVRRMTDEPTLVQSPIPSGSRRTLILQSLGANPLLHTTCATWRRQRPSGELVHVYLDVSGSMEGILRDLYGAVLDCIGWVFPTVHLFSTQVADVTIQDLRSGKCQSTGGTDIGCVASHMAKNRVRRAVLVTDGWVGSPRGEHLRTLELARLAVAYMGNGFNERDLADVANFKDNLKIGN